MELEYRFEDICTTADAIRAHDRRRPEIAVVLGSGLGGFADTLEAATTIPYHELPHFPTPKVEGHAGRLVLGELKSHGGPPRTIVAMQGRVHRYEGWSSQAVVFPIRVIRMLGARVLLVTNAAGSLSAEVRPGELMLLTDQINMTGDNPLRGPSDPRLGPRFPDMSAPYDPTLNKVIEAVAETLGIPLRRGVYVGVSGPSYETAAEVRMLRLLGGDAVGMSTVPEVLAAVHGGFRVCGISCLTNLATGLSDKPLSHDEVEQTASAVRLEFTGLLREVLLHLPIPKP